MRLPVDVALELEKPAQANGCGKNATALKAYLNIEAWQIQDIEQAIEEADRAEFASEDEVNALFRK